MKATLLTIAATATLLGACSPDYNPMEFTVQGNRIIAVGTIDKTTLTAFEDITTQYPNINTLVLQYIQGSVDDDANLIFSRMVRRSGFDTIVPSEGMVASGGTDLFLAGKRRILEPGACVGVHSWGGPGPAAATLSKDHSEHVKYLDYYREMKIPADFYWFTLEAAPAELMHWMDAKEANYFGMTTSPATALGSSKACEQR